jgi:hypothetical protein
LIICHRFVIEPDRRQAGGVAVLTGRSAWPGQQGCAAALYPWSWVSSCIWWRFGADATADIAGAA